MMKPTSFLLLIALCTLTTTASSGASGVTAIRSGLAAPQDARRKDEHSIQIDNDSWQWRHSEDGVGIEVSIRGHVEFARDYSDILSISPGGSIRVTDERGGVTRRFEAKAASGGIQRAYWVNGAARSIDQEVRVWLGRVLDDTVRQGGYDARARVQRILNERGPAGVLQEVSRLKGDYVKRIYLDELLRAGNLDDETIRQVLRQAATEIHSDYEKAQMLVKLSERYLTNDSQRAIYLEGVMTIRSDYEKGRALSAMLKAGQLSPANLVFALRAVKSISSDYERAQVLIRIAEGYTLEEPAGAAYVDALTTLRSDYEKGRVLAAFLKRGAPRQDALLLAVRSAAKINSDYEKAQLLIKVAAAGAHDETVRSALIDAARTINSEYERGRVFNAVFK